MTQSPIEKTIAHWHHVVTNRDMDTLAKIVHPDAVFRSPAAHTPYHSAMALCFALGNVIEVFEDFTYHREFIDDAGRNAALEFSANVAGKSLKGIDLICVDEAGLITEFEVMIRPMSGLAALAAAMGKRVGNQLGAMSKG